MVSVHSMVLGLGAVAIAASTASAQALSSLPVHAVPSFDYPSLLSGNAPQRLLEALTTDGIVALKNVPNYVNLREHFLRRAAECALRGVESPSDQMPNVQRKLFADGTKRYTISTNAGRALADSVEQAFADCPGYAERHLALSLALEHAVNTLGAALDQTAFTASDGHTTISSRQLVSEAVRLDHFHAYEAATTAEATSHGANDGNSHRQLEMSLPLHEDHGLFIAMAAPKFFEVQADGRRLVERELAADASGLIIQTSTGQRVRPVLNGDEVVIMMGTGASRWLKTSHALPAVLHGMQMPEPLVASSDAGRRSLRAWFGKMTLLPAYQRMLATSTPFEAHVNATTRQLLTHEASELKTVGCATGRHLAPSDEKCTLRQCSTKAGASPPDEPCSVICNRKGHSPNDAPDCAAKCTCAATPVNGNICWMLCVANLPESSCSLNDQVCSGQSIKCTNPVTQPPAPTTTAPAPTTTAPAPTDTAPAPTTTPPAPTTTPPTPTATTLTPTTTEPTKPTTTPTPTPTPDLGNQHC